MEELDKAGSALFCICHQKIESFLFIDNILDYLLEEQYDVLPKHDSIICKQSEIDAVEAEMILILDYYLGENTYKLSKKIYTEQSTLEEIRTDDNFINEELTDDTDCKDDLWEDYEMAYWADKEYLSQIDGCSDYCR